MRKYVYHDFDDIGRVLSSLVGVEVSSMEASTFSEYPADLVFGGGCYFGVLYACGQERAAEKLLEAVCDSVADDF